MYRRAVFRAKVAKGCSGVAQSCELSGVVALTTTCHQLPPSSLTYWLMNTYHDTQDEPFNHEAVNVHGHTRTGSSANLLQSESSSGPSAYDSHIGGDEFYDHLGASSQELYSKPEPDYSYDPDRRKAGATEYQDLGQYS